MPAHFNKLSSPPRKRGPRAGVRTLSALGSRFGGNDGILVGDFRRLTFQVRLLRVRPKISPAFAAGYRRPRESGDPGATAAALPALASRFRGNDEEERQLIDIY